MTHNRGLSFYKKKKNIGSAVIKEIFSWIFGIAASIFFAAVLTYFLGMSTYVAGVSMEPTLFNGQQIFINRFIYVISSPKAGDVVVFMPNGNENAHYYVKRVAAVPGDKVLIADGVLYVNGMESEWNTDRILDPGIAENEFTLGSDEFFCIGDNINSSEDSRSANIGPVSAADMLGKVWFHLKGGEEGMGFVQ